MHDLFRGICKQFGANTGRVTLCFLVFSTGMFISCAAYLPSSFTMYLTMVAMGAWFLGQNKVNSVDFFKPLYFYKTWYFMHLSFNPSNAEAIFIQSTRMQRFLKTILTLSCWYSLESSHWVLSDEYPFARVSVIFQVFSHNFVLVKLAFSSIRVKIDTHISKKIPLRLTSSNLVYFFG